MNDPSSILAAIALANSPNLVRDCRARPLPKGLTLLLEIAAGDGQALEQACRLTGNAPQAVQLAASFFVEQVLLEPNADSYRALGTDHSAKSSDLRKHMALLLRWSHPDKVSGMVAARVLDRTVFAHRVTEAWECVKTDERRAAYNRTLPPRSAAGRASAYLKRHGMKPAAKQRTQAGAVPRKQHTTRHKKLVMFALPEKGALSRLFHFLKGR